MQTGSSNIFIGANLDADSSSRTNVIGLVSNYSGVIPVSGSNQFLVTTIGNYGFNLSLVPSDPTGTVTAPTEYLAIRMYISGSLQTRYIPLYSNRGV
jgi:hypothetical protein